MPYPKANPVAKHDLLCSTSIIDAIHNPAAAATTNGSSGSAIDSIETIEAFTSSIVQSALPCPKLPPDIVKLSTIYTYPDAPQKPKPLSRAPRVWRLADRALFDRATDDIASDNNGASNGNNLVKKCDIAVKLPAHIPQGDAKNTKNTKFFYNFVTYLHKQNQVAILACDSAGRIGFIVPSIQTDTGDDWNNNHGSDENDYYTAYICYAPMKEFVKCAKVNYETSKQQQQQLQHADENGWDDADEPQTWTPQYTPPPEEECQPHGWDDQNDGEPETWTPQYTPPPEEECGPKGWGNDHAKMEDDTPALFVPGSSNDDAGGGGWGDGNADENDTAGLWAPATNDDSGGGGRDTTANNDTRGEPALWAPTKTEDSGGGWDTGNTDNGGGWDTGWGNTDNNGGWDTNNNQNDDTTNAAATNPDTGLGTWNTVPDTDKGMKDDGQFHANAGAAAADAFYSGLTRSLDTRADSRLYHMRAFNGWVKATQIAELDPDTSRATSGSKKRSRKSPMRVLDLACGKGGDLGKWTIHQRNIENYVGVDVARGSLVDAALRARSMSQRGNKANALKRCTFTLADLGEDVPGRKRSRKSTGMQKLLTWNLQDETPEAKELDPVFVAKEGGGIAETDRFDVVSIQFAIHYMMQTRKRARRFFQTVSSLLEIGGNLIATTIDARVVVEKLMGLGLDYHFDDLDRHVEVDMEENEMRHGNGNSQRKVKDDERGVGATVSVGNGVCRLKFDSETLHKVFQPPKTSEDMFGLQYTFTLVEGSDHAAGVGEAVDLPEWLTPIPALEELAEESGLKMEYATNFHKFFEERKSPQDFPMAHNALYNMKVLNRDGSISAQEWDVSRMYIALKFRKVRESTVDLGDDEEDEKMEVNEGM